MALYQNSYPYVYNSGDVPASGSFTIGNNNWASATEIRLHDVPFETYGSGSGGIQITGSDSITFESYYPYLGPGSILFMVYSGSTWSYSIDTITDATGYTIFDVTNLTGPSQEITSGIKLVQFAITPAGAGAQITNDANNRLLTATGNQGEINAEANLSFDGSTLNVTGSIVASLGTGTDNSVVVLTSTNELKTDEIDSRVWGATLVDATGTPLDNQVSIFTDANTIEGSDRVTFDGNEFRIDGILSANEKNFDIEHPSKEGYRLRYSVLEGPERGVYVRGKLRGTNCIELPDYWKDLVYEDSITVHLTPYQNSLPHWLERIELQENKIYIGAECSIPSVDYIVYAERKADEPLTIEYKAED